MRKFLLFISIVGGVTISANGLADTVPKPLDDLNGFVPLGVLSASVLTQLGADKDVAFYYTDRTTSPEKAISPGQLYDPSGSTWLPGFMASNSSKALTFKIAGYGKDQGKTLYVGSSIVNTGIVEPDEKKCWNDVDLYYTVQPDSKSTIPQYRDNVWTPLLTKYHTVGTYSFTDRAVGACTILPILRILVGTNAVPPANDGDKTVFEIWDGNSGDQQRVLTVDFQSAPTDKVNILPTAKRPSSVLNLWQQTK